MSTLLTLVTGLALASHAPAHDDDVIAHAGLPALAPPFRVEAGGEVIATKIGHAAPFPVDFDGDGTWDLAVGEFGGGGCRLYKNVGTATEPSFGAFTMLQSAGKPAAMESS